MIFGQSVGLSISPSIRHRFLAPAHPSTITVAVYLALSIYEQVCEPRGIISLTQLISHIGTVFKFGEVFYLLTF